MGEYRHYVYNAHFTAMGLTVGYPPQGQFAGRRRSYAQSWEQIIEASGIQPQ